MWSEDGYRSEEVEQKMKIGLKKVNEDVAENLYEQMPEQELFLKIRDDLLYSRTGIRMDEQVTKRIRRSFWKRLTSTLTGCTTSAKRRNNGLINTSKSIFLVSMC